VKDPGPKQQHASKLKKCKRVNYHILLKNVKLNDKFITLGRKPQLFKAGDEALPGVLMFFGI
jgi:hypothetical protein